MGPQVFRYEGVHGAVLVGYSFAGPVISAIADRMQQRLRHLVYLDALVLESGESSSSRSPERAGANRQLGPASPHPWAIPPGRPAAFGIADPAQIERVAGKLTQHPLQTYYDKLLLANALGNGVPATYARAGAGADAGRHRLSADEIAPGN